MLSKDLFDQIEARLVGCRNLIFIERKRVQTDEETVYLNMLDLDLLTLQRRIAWIKDYEDKKVC